MSSKNKSQLRTENSNNFPNNNSQFITPEKLRDFNNDIIDSVLINEDSGSYLVTSSFDNSSRDLTFTKVDGTTYTNNIPDATVATGSLLETASFDNGTRNMTFTKGDASTFDINIPGSTLDTGSLLVTASVVDATTTYTKGDGQTFDITVNNVANAISASHAVSSSRADSSLSSDTSISASHALNADNAISSSYALTASFAENVVSVDTGSFINTGSTSQTKTANINQTLDAPGTDAQKNFVTINSTNTNGVDYNNVSFAIQNYPSYGRAYQDTFLYEMYDSTDYIFGTEQALNGGEWHALTTATGSGNKGLMRVRDDYAGNSDVDMQGNNIAIGTFGGNYAATGGITIGNSGVSTTINGTLTASIDTGNVLVGDGSGVSYLVPTSSLVDTGSFAIKDQSNTFTTGPQIATGSDGYFSSRTTMPTTGFNQKKLWEANDQNLSVDGNGVYNVVQESLSHFNGYGRWYDGSWYQEFYDSGVAYGAEVTANGGGWRAAVYASGSSNNGNVLIQDNYDGNTKFNVDAQTINIGTGTGGSAPQSITLGKTSAPLNLNASEITVSSSLDIEGGLTSSLQSGYVWVGDGTGRTTTAATSSFGGGGGAAFPYTGDAQITGSLGVSGSLVIQQDSYPDNRLGFKSGSTEYIQMYIDTGSEFVPDAWVINHHSAGQIFGIANANGWIEVNTVFNLNSNATLRGDITCRTINQESSYTATFDKVSVNTTLTLSPQNPLPAGSVGEMAASGSNLYFNNGAVWKEVSFV